MAVIGQPDPSRVPAALPTPSPALGFPLGRPRYLRFLEELGDTQVGPIWIGPWGFASILFFAVAALFNLTAFVQLSIQQHGNLIRDLFSLAVEPPPAETGLTGFLSAYSTKAPPQTNLPTGHLLPANAAAATATGWLNNGGAWLLITLFVSISILCWMANTYVLARKGRLHPYLFWGLTSAATLYFSIYVIHPILVRQWADAPPWGLMGHLDWANAFSVQYGNFYYNPFHMLSIIGLLGSTLLLGMHGATILATAKEGSHHEEEEINHPGSGTEKSQLFWRWTMGFNASARTIHAWAFYFAIFTVLSGSVGVLTSGTLVKNWYAWGVEHSLTSCPTLPEVGGVGNAPAALVVDVHGNLVKAVYASGPGCGGLYPNLQPHPPY